MATISDVTVILPSLNPDEKLIKTVAGLIKVGFEDIVIINDGSDDKHTENFPDEKEYPQCTVLNHWINRGKGAGLKTAFAYIKKTRPDCKGVVTVDGDGQHRPEDVLACAMRMVEENKVILGVRDFNLPGIPARSVFGNKTTAFVLKWLCGIKITDTQTGLRAIPIEFLDTLMTVKGHRFEYETNMLLAFKDYDIPFEECPIHTVYIEENKTSHFNPFKDSIRIYKQIFVYLFSSLSATLIDLLLFYMLYSGVFFGLRVQNGLICTVIARVFSSVYNYFVNCRFVFAKRKKSKYSMLKYYVLVIGIMLCSGLSVTGISHLFPRISAGVTTIIKACIDTALSVLSFVAQREWVFGGKNKE